MLPGELSKNRGRYKKSLEYAHADAHIKKPIDKNEPLNTVKILLEEEA